MKKPDLKSCWLFLKEAAWNIIPVLPQNILKLESQNVKFMMVSLQPTCERQMSTAKSQASHIGCWCVGGRLGWLTGVQSLDFMILSARRKFLKSEATNKSCLNSFWNVFLGRVFQAMASVMQ